MRSFNVVLKSVGRGEVYGGLWWGNLRERNNLENPGTGGRIILRCIFRKWNGVYGLDRSGSGKEQGASICECGKELSHCIKCGKFLD
jgi:hypothetical protein